MLTEEHRELLSAYVDGEVGARQRKTVLRLLRKSAEARATVRQMQETARRLRSLPRQASSPELEVRIVQAFLDRQPQEPPQPLLPPPAAPVTIPLWLGMISAAAVLLVVSLGSFLYFGGLTGPGRSTTRAVKEDKSELPAPDQIPEELPMPAEDKPQAVELPELIRAPRPAVAD